MQIRLLKGLKKIITYKKKMNRVVSFISGNEYSLSDLFGGDTKIIIPDLQRDYCWGDKAVIDIKTKKTRELVTDFVKNIIDIFENESNTILTIGLVYGYEQPHNHIQICDGQQRLTTLFLLLGVINIKAGGCFDDYIISKEEQNDDYEPHLQYAIRESTLYFLSDLARNVFISQNTSITDIKSSNWYFNEYDFDASIQSIISALLRIEDALKDNVNINFVDFGKFVLNNLKVLYYDMENRSRGEETYVVINTTGEPLSSTENIKPLLLGRPSLSKREIETYSDQWENREEWFWQNRGKDNTADNGLNEFFIWYWQIGLMQEKAWKDGKPISLNPRELFANVPTKITENANEIKLSLDNYNKFCSLDNINNYFLALKKLVNSIVENNELRSILLSMNVKNKDENISLSDTEVAWRWLRKCDLDIVLPLITLLAEHKDTQQLVPFARRLRRNYYDSIWSKNEQGELTRRYNSKMDWRYLVQIINQTSEENLLKVDVSELSISKIPKIPLPIWYDEEEQVKEKLRKDGYADSVNEWEDNEYLMGDITPLWKSFDADTLSHKMLSDRFMKINQLCNVFHKSRIQVSDYELANWFRLFLVVSGLVNFGHIPYCSSDFEGCYFSKRPSSPWWLESSQIEKLLESTDMVSYIKEYVFLKVKDYIKSPNNHIELIKSWLTIKTLKASNEGYLLDYYSDRAISAYKNLSDNYILPSDYFSWGNVLLGYSYSYTIFPARNEYDWKVREYLDSPLFSIDFIEDYYNKDKRQLSEENQSSMNNYIITLINQFLGQFEILS